MNADCFKLIISNCLKDLGQTSRNESTVVRSNTEKKIHYSYLNVHRVNLNSYCYIVVTALHVGTEVFSNIHYCNSREVKSVFEPRSPSGWHSSLVV